uniref:Ribosomal protein S14 n=1 Tax=Timspurckia oligopyrenoides TaxID=708627 RepID=A0A6T6MKE2_9RHOD|mmetsp:Transcript_5180/g.9040  ORF Transcript_5180/g.9040 Transcript_5180/m.9040 type:complete len:110 (+) Transcript_5180:128-457(+)
MLGGGGGSSFYYLRTNWKDYGKRKLFAKYELERKVLKTIIRNEALPLPVRVAATDRLATYPGNCSIVRVNKYCLMSGRRRGVYSDLRISRIVLRDLARHGELPGIRKKK